MPGLGTIVNVAAILLGGSLGLLFKRFITEKLREIVSQGLGLAVLVIGFAGVFTSSLRVSAERVVFESTLMMILSLVFGALIGGILKIDDRLEIMSKKISAKLNSNDTAGFAGGFMTATLLFSIGAMAIIGSLEDGINKNTDILFAKSALDCVTAMILAGTFGAGVLLSAFSVGIYQGFITALAFVLTPILSQAVITGITMVGSVLIIGLSFGMLGIVKIKVANLLPAVFIPIIYYAVISLTGK